MMFFWNLLETFSPETPETDENKHDSFDVVLTTFGTVAWEWSKHLAPQKQPCQHCGKMYLLGKPMDAHLQRCAENANAELSVGQAKQVKKRKAPAKTKKARKAAHTTSSGKVSKNAKKETAAKSAARAQRAKAEAAGAGTDSDYDADDDDDAEPAAAAAAAAPAKQNPALAILQKVRW